MANSPFRVEVIHPRSGYGWRLLEGGRVVATGTARSDQDAREAASDATVAERMRAFAVTVLGRK